MDLNQLKLMIGKEKYKVISFDIFDTLLIRPYDKPTDLFEELEEALIMADLGVETTMNIIENLRKRVKKEHIVDPQKM